MSSLLIGGKQTHAKFWSINFVTMQDLKQSVKISDLIKKLWLKVNLGKKAKMVTKVFWEL